MRKAGLLIALALLAMPATALAQHDDHGKAALKKMSPNLQSAFNAGDAAAVAALYTEDGAIYPPNMPAARGRAAIQEYWTAAIESGATVELTTQKMYGMGETATEVGAYSLTAPDGSHIDHGTFMVVYKMEGGEWKMDSDIWNSDMSQ
jgi:uncharacterized protein (TIGR02246 family)